MKTQVSRVEKKSAFGQHYQVSAIGGNGASGAVWSVSEDEAIRQIESGEKQYFTVLNGCVCDLVVGIVREGKYLKTGADIGLPHSLLGLPDFGSGAYEMSAA